MERSDEELAREVQQGNREAFRELVERHQRKITGLLSGMLQNPEDAMEIAQETFAKAFRSLDGFRGESSFYTWLYRIALNLAIDFRRRSRRAPAVALQDRLGNSETDSLYEDVIGDEEESRDPFARARSRELGQRVSEAIEELTPEHRAVILLREVEGLSYEEISDVMQCSKGTVMSRLHYARKRLQNRLRDLL